MASPLSLLFNQAQVESDTTRPEPATNRPGRKPSCNGPSRKKQPKRGMGVAQLERLRLQERWKKITEANPQEPLNLQPALLPVQNPVQSVPMQHGSVSYGVSMISCGGGGGGGLWDLNQGMEVKRIGNNGFYKGGFGPGQVFVNPNQYMVGALDMRVQVGTTSTAAPTVFETSKELSSMPKIMQQCCQCDACFKKKRSNGQNINGYYGRRDNFAEIPPSNGSYFPALNLGNNMDLNAEMGGFSARAARSAFYANNNLNEGVEVVAVHRKGNSVGGSVLIEYEFLPGKSGKSTSFKEMEFPADASVAVGGEASCITTSDHSGYSASNASNSVDLSLKLSY